MKRQVLLQLINTEDFRSLTLPNRLKAIREYYGISGSDLASKIGLCARSIRKYERVLIPQSHSAYIELAKFYNLTLQELYSGVDNVLYKKILSRVSGHICGNGKQRPTLDVSNCRKCRKIRTSYKARVLQLKRRLTCSEQRRVKRARIFTLGIKKLCIRAFYTWNGRKYSTISELCREQGLDNRIVSQRMASGMTLHQAVTLKSHISNIRVGNIIFKSLNEAASYLYDSHFQSKHVTIGQINRLVPKPDNFDSLSKQKKIDLFSQQFSKLEIDIETATEHDWIFYQGDCYTQFRPVCLEAEIDRKVVERYRRANKSSRQEAFEYGLNSQMSTIKPIEVDGVLYKNFRHACEELNLPYNSLLRYKCINKCSFIEAIRHGITPPSKLEIDGQVFSTYKSAASSLGVSISRVYSIMEKTNVSKLEAFKLAYDISVKSKLHLNGQTFKNVAALCKGLGLNPRAVYKIKERKGVTTLEAAKLALKYKKARQVQINGVIYKSAKAACDELGINYISVGHYKRQRSETESYTEAIEHYLRLKQVS